MERRCLGLSKRRPMRWAESERSGSEDRQIPTPLFFFSGGLNLFAVVSLYGVKCFYAERN